jgi:hypothetical protein
MFLCLFGECEDFVIRRHGDLTFDLDMPIRIEKSQNIIFQCSSLGNEHINSHNHTVRTYSSMNNNNN